MSAISLLTQPTQIRLFACDVLPDRLPTIICLHTMLIEDERQKIMLLIMLTIQYMYASTWANPHQGHYNITWLRGKTNRFSQWCCYAFNDYAFIICSDTSAHMSHKEMQIILFLLFKLITVGVIEIVRSWLVWPKRLKITQWRRFQYLPFHSTWVVPSHLFVINQWYNYGLMIQTRTNYKRYFNYRPNFDDHLMPVNTSSTICTVMPIYLRMLAVISKSST